MALAAALAAERAAFNAQVAQARHRDPRFDTAALQAFVRSGVDAVAQAVHGAAPAFTHNAVRDAFEVAVALAAQGLVGPNARTPLVEHAWLAVVPACGRIVAEHTRAVLAMISNAAVYVDGVPGAHPQRWLDEMRLLAPRANTPLQLRVLGQVCAWRAGLAHFRAGAVRAADELPPVLALVATGASEAAVADGVDASQAWAQARRALLASPWWTHGDERLPVQRQGMAIGAFTGLGGTFAQPPQVRVAAHGFLVRSGDRFSLLVADAHGAVLLPASAEEFDQAATAASTRGSRARLDGTRLEVGARTVDLEWPEPGLAFVEDDHMAVVSSPYSHALRVVAKDAIP